MPHNATPGHSKPYGQHDESPDPHEEEGGMLSDDPTDHLNSRTDSGKDTSTPSLSESEHTLPPQGGRWSISISPSQTSGSSGSSGKNKRKSKLSRTKSNN